MMPATNDKIEKVVAALRDQLIKAREDKTTGQARAFIDLQDGGPTTTKVELSRVIK